MQYFDKHGIEIKAGMYVTLGEGCEPDLVHNTVDACGNPDLGVNASNEAYLERTPFASREFYSLSNFDMREVEICDQVEGFKQTM